MAAPLGLLVGAIIHGNEWRDIGDDARAGIATLSGRFGREFAHYTYLALVIGAYISVGLAVALTWLPPTVAITLFSLPFLARVIRAAEFGAAGQARAIAMIDIRTAQLHLAFGTLLVVGSAVVEDAARMKSRGVSATAESPAQGRMDAPLAIGLAAAVAGLRGHVPRPEDQLLEPHDRHRTAAGRPGPPGRAPAAQNARRPA